ncbi:2-polyprenyl-3-methyl-6-methoxy-1,4-benzoquinone monooxygenase [Simiduia agarivorans]|uniref:3-demethoxyubiquinol 3-hydroxylase n=1 Tax=Simiduia agarivorans (strain DSM 21679 / JCM 13881 / BCRC 17597 / SA1) TaxID=1117647 RepID=K4KM57_SIMAS|nr:2-polyprenyl-3-methyl-6-methoxy-1,4-benzoquinone monooxygenase [Simiduia agarivorans]AFV00250.1 ubiquinone biosynthesis protein Coenzyme Q7 Coq7 family protein [Simiduia agarivorans SA1 = DSM 21679]
MKTTLTAIDHLIVEADKVLRTLAPGKLSHHRPNPAGALPEADMNDTERKHAAGLMRVNHSGEVCAQALYQGQALTARLPEVRDEMAQAAAEEIDHLAWCEQRLHQLDSRPSLLNPLWYGLSFGIGAGAGLISDKVSLGFVAATEDQVCKHLDSHLASLPEQDARSRAIVGQMREDEARHAETALNAGGLKFPAPVKRLMSLTSRLMTEASYRL